MNKAIVRPAACRQRRWQGRTCRLKHRRSSGTHPVFDAERGWSAGNLVSVVRAGGVRCELPQPHAVRRQTIHRPSSWAFQVGGKNWLMYHRDYYPTGGPYKWRRWHKGGDLRKRYESLTFRPSLSQSGR